MDPLMDEYQKIGEYRGLAAAKRLTELALDEQRESEEWEDRHRYDHDEHDPPEDDDA